jgi:indolepyruvate ferredoxin oxidoreductase alpha subunit
MSNRTRLLLGDEAVAHAAADSGIGGVFGYPGTPATEIFEWLQKRAGELQISARWSGNEKVAYEEALGMAYIGRRALVAMKCAGLNVAFDAYINSALVEVLGGLVVVVADDPSIHSSQNEQDTRYHAEFARTPWFEPSDQQECYDMTREAFALSEEFKVPVLVRLVTRIAHSRAPVQLAEPAVVSHGVRTGADRSAWTLLPVYARVLNARLWEKRARFAERAEESRWNRIVLAQRPAAQKMGVVCSGAGCTYALEAMQMLGVEVDHLRLGFFPAPARLVREFLRDREDILAIEDGYPYIEERLLGIAGTGPRIHGRSDGTIPATGELTPDRAAAGLAAVLGLPFEPAVTHNLAIPPRLPSLCPGCPHCDTYRALNEALESREPSVVFSDIGCYTLGALEPYIAIDTTVEMGASVGMAKGAAQGGLRYSVAVVGDSTFAHSALPTLLAAAAEDTPMTVIILDNDTVGMTGMQSSLGSGDRLLGALRGFGVAEPHLRVIDPVPKAHARNVQVIVDELDHRGLSVIVAQRDCIHLARKR